MRKQAPVIEWTIVENDADWERQSAPFLPDTAAVATRRRPLQYYFWPVAALLLVLVVAGDWWRRTTQVRVQQAAAVTALAQQELAARLARPNELTRRARRSVTGHPMLVPGSEFGLDLYTVDVLQDDQAVTHVVTVAKGGAYRQTLFYRRTAEGWQPIPPALVFWGPARSLETPFFVYHFRQNDESVVTAVAPQLDVLYSILHRNFGLLLTPNVEKRVIEVSLNQNPGEAVPWFGVADQLLVPSPARYPAPVALTDVALLQQSLALALLDQVLAQARTQYAVRDSWRPLLDGLRLWQLWDIELPLAVWRKEIVQWLYIDLPTTKVGQPVVLPARYTELCATHKLWMWSPLQIHIPLICTEWKLENANLLPWSHSAPPTQLGEPSISASDAWGAGPHGSHPGQVVALATLIEYAMDTYGRDRLPVLLAGLGQYESWETLLPAVYGVSATEFEAGWQAYLATHYGVENLHRWSNRNN